MFNLMIALVVVVCATLGVAQDRTAEKAAVPAVTVPSFMNTTCPIMGKPAKAGLSVDTPKGRVYVCCKMCIPKIEKDADAAYAKAYPTTKKLAATACPITGDKIEANAPTVTLQGYEFSVCCKDCVKAVHADAAAILAKLTNPKLHDVGNRASPIDGKATTSGAFCLVGDEMVRLSSPDELDAVKKDPTKALDKARSIAAEATKPAAESKPAMKHEGAKKGDGHDDHNPKHDHR